MRGDLNTLVNPRANAQNQYIVAEQLAQAGKFAEAWSSLQALDARLLPASLHATYHFLCGHTLLELQRPAEALAPLQEAVRAQRSNAAYRLACGAALHLTGKLDEAEKHYREAMKLAPAAENPPFNLGMVLIDKADYDGAIRAFRTAIARKANCAGAMSALADLLSIRGEITEAAALCDRALKIDPRHASGWNVLGKMFERQHDFVQAAQRFERATQCDPALADAWFNLARMNGHLNQLEQAADHFAHAVALQPHNEKFKFMMGGVAGAQDGSAPMPDRPPDSYVRELFDQYAHTFDKNLIDGLGYRPQAVCDAIEPWFRERRAQGGKMAALDLGCGTGLLGPLLAADCSPLVGVDLSPRMLEKAQDRGYTALHIDEITAFLDRSAPEQYELVLATDVFIYVGELSATFRGVGKVLRPRGVFAFSVEALESAANDDGLSPYKLLLTGRYAHRDRYLQDLAEAGGFTLLSRTAIDLRLDAGKPIQGTVYAFQLA